MCTSKSNSRVVGVTNRHLACDEKEQFMRIAGSGVKFLILREKDMTVDEYEVLAQFVLAICEKYNMSVLLHTHYKLAQKMNYKKIHVPLAVLKEMSKADKKFFTVIGVSIHSSQEAMEAERLGATYLTAGHVFATDCKKDLAPRGLLFLKEVCEAVSIPVYAIGGITPQNANDCILSGAAGVCLMSSLMKSDSPEKLRKAIDDSFLCDISER